jgi:hypothetical protein
MPFDTATAAISDLVSGECRQEAGSRPTLLVGTRGKQLPARHLQPLDEVGGADE